MMSIVIHSGEQRAAVIADSVVYRETPHRKGEDQEHGECATEDLDGRRRPQTLLVLVESDAIIIVLLDFGRMALHPSTE